MSRLYSEQGGFAVSSQLRIAPAAESDVPLILSFIRKLAEYEKLSHLVVATEANIREHVFGSNPVAEVLLAYWDGEPVGFALYLRNFSTFLGQAGIYLEDLFVEPEHRGKGIGKALLIRLAKIAIERGYGRLEWAVLDWNTPSIEFYRSLGAVPLDEWTAYRLTGDALSRLALGDRRGP
jgi:GNAT superfamily N-acetyltransferase